MSTWIVTRHGGAIDWLAREGVTGETVAHFDSECLQRGDTVIGNLPMHVAADVCANGARFLTIELDVPPEVRGKELTVDDMLACGAKLIEYRVERVLRAG